MVTSLSGSFFIENLYFFIENPYSNMFAHTDFQKFSYIIITTNWVPNIVKEIFCLPPSSIKFKSHS